MIFRDEGGRRERALFISLLLQPPLHSIAKKMKSIRCKKTLIHVPLGQTVPGQKVLGQLFLSINCKNNEPLNPVFFMSDLRIVLELYVYSVAGARLAGRPPVGCASVHPAKPYLDIYSPAAGA
jgi:hypothetical protein